MSKFASATATLPATGAVALLGRGRPSAGRVQPEYIEMQAGSSPPMVCVILASLPQQAQPIVRKVEELVGVPVSYISAGPERDEISR